MELINKNLKEEINIEKEKIGVKYFKILIFFY
jgi:hypothetical protein